MPNQSDPNQNQQTTNNPQGVATPPTENNPQVVVPDFQATEIPSIPIGEVAAPPKPPGVPESSAPIEAPPPIISSTPKKKFGGGKIIATILGFLILAGGIVGGVILTQQQQDIRERAWIPEWGGDPNEDPNKPGNEDDPEKEEDWIPNQDELPTYTGDTQTDPLNCGSIGNACDSGDSCAGGVCISPINTDCGRQNDPGAPGCCSRPCVGQIVCEPGVGGGRKECKSGGGQHCTIETQSDDCSGANPGEPPDTPPSTNPPGLAMCQDVRAYGPTIPTQFTNAQLSELKAGDQVRFCVSGGPSPKEFDKARFTINGVQQPETTTPTDKGMEPFIGFCQLYTIPTSVTSFNITAQIHHPTLDWK